jgi:hypothetical protein
MIAEHIGADVDHHGGVKSEAAEPDTEGGRDEKAAD